MIGIASARERGPGVLHDSGKRVICRACARKSWDSNALLKRVEDEWHFDRVALRQDGNGHSLESEDEKRQ